MIKISLVRVVEWWSSYQQYGTGCEGGGEIDMLSTVEAISHQLP